MNPPKWYDRFRGTVYPLLMAVLGLILLLNPDVASALLGRVTGWILILAGVAAGVYAILSRPVRVATLVLGVLLLFPGIYLLAKPMALAVNIGKVGGILLLIQGITGLFQVQQLRSYGLQKSWILPACTLVLGGILLFFPVSASRVVFRVMGTLLLVAGIVNIIARIRENSYEDPDFPDIIDADE